jgi:hypothetical protein
LNGSGKWFNYEIEGTRFSGASRLTIHDELIYELMRLDKEDKPTGDIIRIIGCADMKYWFEESHYHSGNLSLGSHIREVFENDSNTLGKKRNIFRAFKSRKRKRSKLWGRISLSS